MLQYLGPLQRLQTNAAAALQLAHDIAHGRSPRQDLLLTYNIFFQDFENSEKSKNLKF